MMRRGLTDDVEAVRRFNRFYSRRIGELEERLLHSDFSLTEIRVLFELAQVPVTTAVEIGQQLGLDSGYLSRILQRLWLKGLLSREASMRDRRKFRLRLTPAGRDVFAPLDHAASREVAQMLQALDEKTQVRLLGAMRTIMHVLDQSADL